MSKYKYIPKFGSGDLLQFQSMSLEAKENFALKRIEEFIDAYGEDKVYESFSGGKDSVVLNHLVERIVGIDQVEKVYFDTWLEYPSIRTFVKENYDVTIIKPSMTMKEIVTQYGWCFPSKEASTMIYDYHRGVNYAQKKIRGLKTNGEVSEFRQMFKKYLPFADKAKERGIVISPYCCFKQKEEPARDFESKTGKFCIVGTRAEESLRRKNAWMKTGCNTFSTTLYYDEEKNEYVERETVPKSRPISIFTEQDILNYIVKYHLNIAEPYGQIYRVGECIGQQHFFDESDLCCASKFVCQNYALSGEQRTGCTFCPVGCHLNNFQKFRSLRKAYPKLFDYCMEELNEKALISLIEECFGIKLRL